MDEFTLKHVAKIFPDLKPRTLQVWVDRGVIQPSTPSSGTGHPIRFSYDNLVEIGLVIQFVQLGLKNSHKQMRKIIEEFDHRQGNFLIGYGGVALIMVNIQAIKSHIDRKIKE